MAKLRIFTRKHTHPIPTPTPTVTNQVTDSGEVVTNNGDPVTI